MKVLVVYCHPSANSFTHAVKEAFVRGALDAGHAVEVSDLYGMNFNPVMSEEEYLREGFYDASRPVPDDVLREQNRINRAEAIAFIYPVFWTEAPALLTGWFQRVWTYGYAYGDAPMMKPLQKALFLITMGGSLTEEIRLQQLEAMKTVMLGDRINWRAASSEMIAFDEITRGYGNDGRRAENSAKFLRQAYQAGQEIASGRAE